MSDVSGTMTIERPQLGLWDRLATLISWILAGVVFLTVGWVAMAPDDPLGPVSIFARRDGALMLPQAAALAGVVGGAATVIAGRRLADAGTLAAALGLALVSIQGATAEQLLMRGADSGEWSEHGLALRFALEAGGWLSVICVAGGVSALVGRRFSSQGSAVHCVIESDTHFGRALPAGFDIPGLSTRWFEVPGKVQTDNRGALRHTLIAATVGLATMALLSTGLSSRSIRTGQVCFVVAGAICSGTYVAYRFAPVRSALWSIAALGIIVLVGYVWAALRPPVSDLPPNIPASHFMRVLPLQFVSVGTVAAVATFWYVYTPRAEMVAGLGHAKTRRPSAEVGVR